MEMPAPTYTELFLENSVLKMRLENFGLQQQLMCTQTMLHMQMAKPQTTSAFVVVENPRAAPVSPQTVCSMPDPTGMVSSSSSVVSFSHAEAAAGGGGSALVSSSHAEAAAGGGGGCRSSSAHSHHETEEGDNSSVPVECGCGEKFFMKKARHNAIVEKGHEVVCYDCQEPCITVACSLCDHEYSMKESRHTSIMEKGHEVVCNDCHEPSIPCGRCGNLFLSASQIAFKTQLFEKQDKKFFQPKICYPCKTKVAELREQEQTEKKHEVGRTRDGKRK